MDSVKTSEIKNWVILIFIFLFVLDCFVWSEIVFNGKSKNPEIYFLNVGQGDSEMVVLQNNVKVLIDGGPDKKILENIPEVLSYFDRHIDLVVMSHPQLDHFGGLIEVLKRYQVGAFIWNGIENNTESFAELKKVIKENNIPQIILAEGDKIKYQENEFKVLFPSGNLLATDNKKNINDDALVLELASPNGSALFTADIGKNIEDYLIGKYNLNVDILKVGHHGSKTSSVAEFLKSVSPKISVIEVGKNSYGHPTKEALARLSDVGSKIFRTDKNGIIKLVLDNNKINVFAQK